MMEKWLNCFLFLFFVFQQQPGIKRTEKLIEHSVGNRKADDIRLKVLIFKAEFQTTMQ